MKPQTEKGTFKRLSFEELGGDDYDRSTRAQKGLHREILTPKYTIPFSSEGTEVYMWIDRNEVLSAAKIRALISRLISNEYPLFELVKAKLAYTSNNATIRMSYETRYNGDYGVISPRVNP